MEVTPASLNALFVAFNKLYQSTFDSTQPSAEVLATRVPSNTETNTYAWMAKLLRMRKWVGDRLVQNIESRSYSLTNQPFEMTLAVPGPKIRDDQIGIYNPLFGAMGAQTKLWMDDLLVQALMDGDDSVLGLGWDGVPFFSTSHPIDLSGRETTDVQSNNLSASALNSTTVDAARVALANMKGDDNRPLGCRMTHIIVPPANEKAARDVVVAQFLASGATNTLAGAAEIIVLPQLSADTAGVWYVADLSKPIKPLVAQIREEPDFVQRTAPDSDPKFKRDEYEFGSQARGVAGYGLYFTMIRNHT